jgi:ADP-heptose:LPS heptosyltransferase
LAENRQKIPLLLRLKRIKNSPAAERINSLFSFIKPAKKYKRIPERILLIRNDRIGDAVVTLPVIRNIKMNYPGMKVDVLVSDKNKFVFENFNYADEIIEFNWTPAQPAKLYKLPVLGGFLQFIRYAILAYLFSPSSREKIKQLKAKKYDAAADLVGLFRNALLCNWVSAFSIGPRKFAVHIAYSYYIDTNWVSGFDSDFMSNKIERALENALGLSFTKRDTTLPLLNIENGAQSKEAYDIVFHLGTSELRRFNIEKEKKLIEQFSGLKVLVTDSSETENYLELKNNFHNNNKITFKIFDSLQDAVNVCRNSRVLFCYDGGQAHYLSQFIRTIIVFGPGSVSLWRPLEFSDYSLIEESSGGVQAFQSNGKFKHIAVYYPIWCRPCFDVGCREKPCLSRIESEFISGIIKKYCLNYD